MKSCILKSNYGKKIMIKKIIKHRIRGRHKTQDAVKSNHKYMSEIGTGKDRLIQL